jgi:hypothetical protein
VKRTVTRIQRVTNSTISTIKKTLPIDRRPGKVFGCWPNRLASAPVDIVQSNQAQVKWTSLSRTDTLFFCELASVARSLELLAMLECVKALVNGTGGKADN